MPEIKDVFAGFLSKTLNMDENGVASLYNEDGTLKDNALSILLEKDVDRVKSLKPDNSTEIFNDAHKKAKAEVMKAVEKEFQEKTGFKSDKKGVDLFLEYANETAKKANSEINEDFIKKHPYHISTIEKLQQEKDEAINAESQKLIQFQGELKKKETFSSVAEKASTIFNSLKPILSKDATRAKYQMDDFVNKLKDYEYEIQGDRIVVLKDGKVLEDAHGNRIAFDKIVKETAERYYDFHAAEPRSFPDTTKDKNATPNYSFQVPKDEREYAQAITDPKRTVEERTAIKEAWDNKEKVNV